MVMSEALAGQTFPAQVLPDLQGNGPVRQRSLFADLIFCYFFIKKKVVASAAMSGFMRQVDYLQIRSARSGIASLLAMTHPDRFEPHPLTQNQPYPPNTNELMNH